MTTPSRYRFSDDVAEMDRSLIHGWISTTYWALGRSRSRNDTAMDNSANFGMFDTEAGAQVAFARVITDYVTFAWLADVFVTEEARGHGVGVALVGGILDRLAPLDLKRVGLRTADAHGLYEKFGFSGLAGDESWMTLSYVAQ